MMPGGGGKVQRPWQIWRKPKTISIATKGAKVGPKIAAPMRQRPKRSMKIELVMRAALAARSCLEKYRCQRPVRSWTTSPMPSFGADLRAISDCVQNQLAAQTL